MGDHYDNGIYTGYTDSSGNHYDSDGNYAGYTNSINDRFDSDGLYQGKDYTDYDEDD